MQVSDFDFDLPPALIAKYPSPERTGSRLMYVDGRSSVLSHHHFPHILSLLNKGDLLVFNDTKVIPARLLARKKTGGRVEILLERLLDEKNMLAQVRASKTPKEGEVLYLEKDISLVVREKRGQFFELSLCSSNEASLLQVIENIGQIPLPPYLHRLPDESDKERYQTVYAKYKGSVAAPTAGFHFDEALLGRLRAKEVELGYLTLHIGAGTFTPLRTNAIAEHQMHAESFTLSPRLAEQIRAAKARGNKVVAVGTTTMRALESASRNGCTQPFSGETSIFIYPGYTFNCADALITNLHLPTSTLLMLVCAFAGQAMVLSAYREAVHAQYRFYSYGDAMWLNKYCET